MRKKLLGVFLALTMTTVLFSVSTVFAQTGTPDGSGQMDGGFSFSYNEKGDIVVTGDHSNKESVFAMAAAYEDGRMVDFKIIEVAPGKDGKLALDDWGETVKLFAMEEDQSPVCVAEEIWTAPVVVLENKIAEAYELVTGDFLVSTDGTDVTTDTLWVTEAVRVALKDAMYEAEEGLENGSYTTEEEFEAAVSKLEEAISAFQPQYGTKTGFKLGRIAREVRDYSLDLNTNKTTGSITLYYEEGTGFSPMDQYGLCMADGTVVTRGYFGPDADGNSTTSGSITLAVTGLDAAEYEVAYKESGSSKWKSTGEVIDLTPIDENAFRANVVETEVDCTGNTEMVEAGTVKVTFTFENYTDSVVFGLMDHDNDDTVALEAVFETVDETAGTGSVTFDVKNKASAYYEVVYYLADQETWVGTDEYVDLTFVEKTVKDTLDVVELDLSRSDEWKTDGYIYDFIDVTFEGAEWGETSYEDFVYRIDGEEFSWDFENDVPGNYKLEVDVENSYDEENEIGYVQAMAFAYISENGKVKAEAGDSYEVEIEFPASFLNVTSQNYVIDGETMIVDFTVNIVDSKVDLPPVKDTLDKITFNVGEADDWRTEGYVYDVIDIPLNGAKWRIEPNWDHVSYWIEDEQFVWDPEIDYPGKYEVELDMMPEYDEEGNLSMKAMVFAYVENVTDGKSYDMEIHVPTYMLELTDDDYRITRNESAVIDFTVIIENCEGYVAPVRDTLDVVELDLSRSDEWKTDGYIYDYIDVTFEGAEWGKTSYEDFVYRIDGEEFSWDFENDVPGNYKLEVDVENSYDKENEIGYVQAMAFAYIGEDGEVKAEAGDSYEVEIEFPASFLKLTSEDYAIKGETVTIDFTVNITDSEVELIPVKDTLEEITIDLTTADKWQTEGYVYDVIDIPLNGAKWRVEPYWDHVSYWIEDEQFIWDAEIDYPGKYKVELDMMTEYDEEGNLSAQAMVFAYVDNVTAGESYDMEIHVPTYMLELTDDDYRITRNESAVIDFKVNIAETVVESDITFTQNGNQVTAS